MNGLRCISGWVDFETMLYLFPLHTIWEGRRRVGQQRDLGFD